MEECVFCKIIKGELPANKIYEDENVLAFLDANPVSRGHTLVVPKKHIETIYGAEDEAEIWEAIVVVSKALRDSLNPKGLNITQNNGEAAGQEVFHLHFHLTPRYTGDEVELNYDRSELEQGKEIAENISEKIGK